jgi:hypothetical protein
MSETLRRVQTLVLAGDYLISDHGFDELAKDGILFGEVLTGIATAIAIEDYPDRARGLSVLALRYDADRRPVHVLWGIPAGKRRPAVLVTAYRPDLELWDDDFKRRRVP